MNENILNEESNTLTENLVRIRAATDDMRATVEMTSENSIEDVVNAVSDLKAENEQLKYDIEHCEDRVFNEYFNMNLTDSESWRDLEKKGIPYHANGATNLANFFEHYPGKYIKVIGEWGKPTDINRMFYQCQATDIDIPLLDTSLTENFEYALCGCRADVETVQRWINHWNTLHATTLRGLFNGYQQGTQEHKLNVSHININNVNDLYGMFSDAKNIIGFENWDVANTRNFECIFSRFTPESDNEGRVPKNTTINLTNWDVIFPADTWINCNGMFRGCNARRILMPNFDTSLVYQNSSFGEFCAECWYLEYADFRKMVFNEDSFSDGFRDVSPICIIIVKNEEEKQKILERNIHLLAVYTPEEYEQRDWATVNIDLRNWDGESLIDEPNTSYYIDSQDPNGNWHTINSYDVCYYTAEKASITLPKNNTYRLWGYMEGQYFEPVEFTVGEDEMTVSAQGGVKRCTFTLNLKDSSQGEKITTPIKVYKKVGLEWEYWGESVDGTAVVKFKYGDYVYIKLEDERGYYPLYSNSYSWIYYDRSVNVFLAPRMISYRSSLCYENGELLPKMDLTYSMRIQPRDLSYYTYFYDNPQLVGTDFSYKDVVENDLVGVVDVTINNETYTQTLTKEDIVLDDDYSAYWEMQPITLPTPEYGYVTIYIRDDKTKELIDPTLISGYIRNNSSPVTEDYRYENPKTFKVIKYYNYEAGCEQIGDIYGRESEYIYVTGNTDVYIDLKPLVHFDMSYVDENGDPVPDGSYREYKIIGFDSEDNQLNRWNWGSWNSSYRCNIKQTELDNVAYFRISVWDSSLERYISVSEPLIYNNEIMTYAATIQQDLATPIVWTETSEPGKYICTDYRAIEDLRMTMLDYGIWGGVMYIDSANRFIDYYHMPLDVLDVDYCITRAWFMGTGDAGDVAPFVSIQKINNTETLVVENE